MTSISGVYNFINWIGRESRVTNFPSWKVRWV